jgi:hypothetical protein
MTIMPYRIRLPFLCLSGLLFSSGIWNGCNGDSPASDVDDKALSIEFKLPASPLKGLTPDSLGVSLTLGNDPQPQTFTYNWKTGSASRTLSATEGQTYKLRLEVFACNYRIGMGEIEGIFKQGVPIALQPIWDTLAVRNAGICRGATQCLPGNPAADYGLALAGRLFSIPTTCDTPLTYRWFVRKGDSTLFTGEGGKPSFLIPDSLKGSNVSVRLQVVLDGIGREERKWILTVLAEISKDKLSRTLVRNAPSASVGSALTYAYDEKGRLSLVRIFNSLQPAPETKPIAVESLFYAENGSLIQARLLHLDGSIVDSAFTYGAGGTLAQLKVMEGSSTVRDTLIYGKGDVLTGSHRYVNGTLRDSIVFTWSGKDARSDSVFSLVNKGLELVRVIENRFQEDSLSERRTLLYKGRLSPYRKELWAYNGIGRRIGWKIYTEGFSLSLEESHAYKYDAQGRLDSLFSKDEVTGDYFLAAAYEYTGAGGAAKRSGSGTIEGATAAQILISDLAFDHEGWRQTRKRD